MTGCLLARACFVACLFGESSQQRVPPHTWHVRKWTHSAPLLTQSSHSRRFGCLTVATARICVHVVSGIVFLLFSQYLMDEGDRNRSFTHRRRHALDVAGADVTDGKHSGYGRFKEMRGASERPMGRSEIIVRKVRSGLDEAPRVERDTAIKPARIGYGARHDEDMADFMCLDVSNLAVPPAYALQTIGSF